jgi:hypothetical protein
MLGRRRTASKRAPAGADAGLSIVYLTYRFQPRFDWFADSLAAQLVEGDELEVIFVDGRHSPHRTADLERVVGGRFSFRHVAPKPTPYNGPHRLTGRDYFSAASARNTGVIYGRKPYVVFVDDACVLMPGWLDEVRNAARDRCVIGGAYWKRWEMVVDRGMLISSRNDQTGRDTRWSFGESDRLVKIRGGQLFGCSCGLPRELLLEVNGYGELCDSIGGEDWELGLRLEQSGAPVYYSRRMLTIESEELHRQGEPPLKLDKLTDERSYMRRLRDFGVKRRTTSGRCDSSHMLIDICCGTRSVRNVGNYYELSDLDEAGLLGLVEHMPRQHWFDLQPLSEM